MMTWLYMFIGWFLSFFINPNAPIKTRAGRLSYAQVNAITDRCRAPRGLVKIEGGQLIIYRAKDIAITGCVLEALQATGETRLSAIRNQAYRTP